MLGRVLDHYRIESKLGEGGMGVVYKARDTLLGRAVAIKVLPGDKVADPTRKQRFVQEAKAASGLNHPNIITIHEIRSAGGVDFIVMEYVEGATLADVIPHHGMRVHQALRHAIHIADALAKAHGAGILHRDLKPSNIMVTDDGRVKILDFGLAKLLDPPEVPAEATTLTVRPRTEEGTLLGTAAYMSPEQAEGLKLDARSDIFSLGTILYEMVTGRRPFTGESRLALLNRIVNEDPQPPSALVASIGSDLEKVILRCLRKDPNRRFQTMADLKVALEDLETESASTPRKQILGARRPWWWLWIAGVAAAILFVLASVLYLRNSTRKSTGSSVALGKITYTQLTDQPGQEIYPSLSPDGKSFVYARRTADKWDIYLQRVGGRNAVNLTKDSSVDDTSPVLSPDGEQITFRSERDGGGIFVMGATGENVKRVADFGYNPAWSPDGREIVCSSATFTNPAIRQTSKSQLFRVNIATGEKRGVTPQLETVLQPNWSPHGYRIAYWAVTRGQYDIWTIPASGAGLPVAVTQDLAVDWDPVWSPDGTYLYFASNRGGSMNLWRVPIDEKSGKLLGGFEPVTTPSEDSGYLSFSRDGHQMAYVQQEHTANLFRVGFDSTREVVTGQPVPVTQGSMMTAVPAVSPDGEWIAFYTTGKHESLFVVRKDGSGLRQLTSDAYSDRRPAWSPDGKSLAFQSTRGGKYDVWTIHPDGSGLEQVTYTPDGFVAHPVWSPDGKRLVYSIQNRIPFVMEFDKPWRSQSPQALPPLGEADTWWEASSWSPDGQKLAGFELRTDGKFTGISVYSFEMHKYDRVTDFGWDSHWLNDSRRLLFGPSPPRTSAFYLVDTQSRKVHEILSVAPDAIRQVAISPDNRWIYFSKGVTEADIWLAHFE